MSLLHTDTNIIDGNRCAAITSANRYLTSRIDEFLALPEKEVYKLRKLLVRYYEGENAVIIASVTEEICLKTPN